MPTHPFLVTRALIEGDDFMLLGPRRNDSAEIHEAVRISHHCRPLGRAGCRRCRLETVEPNLAKSRVRQCTTLGAVSAVILNVAPQTGYLTYKVGVFVSPVSQCFVPGYARACMPHGQTLNHEYSVEFQGHFDVSRQRVADG